MVANGGRPHCRHCRERVATRPKGLCKRCSYTPAVRSLYPVSRGDYARRGSGNGCFGGAVPARPTHAAPGTAEKLAVMAARAARGEQLFHPADAAG